MNPGRPVLSLTLIVLLGGFSCADVPLRTKATSGGQGSANVQRVPVATPADRQLEKQVAELRGQISQLEAENARLRAATQPVNAN